MSEMPDTPQMRALAANAVERAADREPIRGRALERERAGHRSAWIHPSSSMGLQVGHSDCLGPWVICIAVEVGHGNASQCLPAAANLSPPATYPSQECKCTQTAHEH